MALPRLDFPFGIPEASRVSMYFLGAVHLLLVGVLACQVHVRFGLLRTFGGLPGYLLSCGLTLFLVNWADFLLYALLGWGWPYLALSWIALLAPILYFQAIRPRDPPSAPGFFRLDRLKALLSWRQWDFWALFLAVFVLARFYAGINEDKEGQIWVVFSFVDTAFHLSVTNAFLESPRFPPMDLDMAPLPLKYHFLADFHVAHLVRLGLPALTAVWLMNLVSATVLVGSLWAVFSRWLKLPARWVMLAGLIFLFLNTALVNLLHYLLLKPAFFDATRPFVGILRYPYFNFESIQSNLLEPQRGLLFTMPVLLLVLHVTFGEPVAAPDDAPAVERERTATLHAFLLICLLPFSHIIGFAVLALCLLPALWRHRVWFLSCWARWLPVFALGLLQLLYLLSYGPPGNPGFSGWDATQSIPLHDFAIFPAPLRRLAFWFFVNGDFFCWGLGLAGLALLRCARARPAPEAAARVGGFLHRWRWYFAVCGALFLLINFYRYSYAWGDSNKFVFFLNLGLTLAIVLGAAQWLDGSRRILSHALWWILLVVTIAPPTYTFYRRVVLYPLANILFFHRHEVAAGEWLKTAAGPRDLVLTAPFTDSHFVSPLAAQPTPAGIYADSNPSRQLGRSKLIGRIYEEADFALLQQLHIRFVCLSRTERRVYKLHPYWLALAEAGTAVVFRSGQPEEFESVIFFDAHALADRAPPSDPAAAATP